MVRSAVRTALASWLFVEEPVDVGRAGGGNQFEIGDNRPSDGYPTHRTTVDVAEGSAADERARQDGDRRVL